MPSTASAQGGGNANAVGLAIQNSANSAAATQNSAAMEQSSGASASPPGMNTGAPTGLDSGGGSAYSAELSGEAMYGAEMYGAEMSGGSYPGGAPGMPGGGPGGRPAPPGVQGMMMSAGGSYLNSFAEFFNRPLSPDAVRFQPTLAERAALAFHYGDQRKALALFYGHLIAETASATGGLEAIRYNPLSRRPAWAVRVGVSLRTRVADSYANDPQPIREGDVYEPPTNRAGRNPMGVAGRGRGGQMAAGSGSMELAEPGMAGMGAGMASGAELGGEEMMGADGMMMSGEEMAGMAGAAGMNAPGRNRPAAPAVNPAIAAAASANQTLESHLGLISDLVKAQLTSRFNSGKLGTVLPALAARGPALAEKAAQSGLAIPPGSGGPMMWVPGVDFVGTGEVNQMIEKCRENEIDVLVHFDVVVKELRGEPQYDARCRLINCTSGENIAVSKLINKREVLMSARKRTNAVVVGELLQPVFEGLDAKVFAMPMPPLQPQHANTRIDLLLAKPNSSRPDVLAELTMFHHKRLVDDDQYEQLMYFAAGDDGLRLLYGAPEQRVEVAEKLVDSFFASP